MTLGLLFALLDMQSAVDETLANPAGAAVLQVMGPVGNEADSGLPVGRGHHCGHLGNGV
jgi:hypothetical protein